MSKAVRHAIDALCDEIEDGHLQASTFPADFLMAIKAKIARLTAELARVTAERDESRLDAERYRFLKTLEGQFIALDVIRNKGCETMDAAIDEAMKHD